MKVQFNRSEAEREKRSRRRLAEWREEVKLFYFIFKTLPGLGNKPRIFSFIIFLSPYRRAIAAARMLNRTAP
jgi:hypothetical protein